MPSSDREKLQIAATVSGSIDTFKDNLQHTQGMFYSSTGGRREQGTEGEKQDLDYDSLSASIALEVCN